MANISGNSNEILSSTSIEATGVYSDPISTKGLDGVVLLATIDSGGYNPVRIEAEHSFVPTTMSANGDETDVEDLAHIWHKATISVWDTTNQHLGLESDTITVGSGLAPSGSNTRLAISLNSVGNTALRFKVTGVGLVGDDKGAVALSVVPVSSNYLGGRRFVK